MTVAIVVSAAAVCDIAEYQFIRPYAVDVARECITRRVPLADQRRLVFLIDIIITKYISPGIYTIIDINCVEKPNIFTWKM